MRMEVARWRACMSSRSHRWYVVQVANQAASKLPAVGLHGGGKWGAWLIDAPAGEERKRVKQPLVVSCACGVTILYYDYAENKYAARVLVHLCRQFDLLHFFLNLAVQSY